MIPDCARALTFCQERFSDITHCLGVWGDPLPEVARNWEGDYVISYLSRWVVPDFLLKRARKASFNFHPASPEYPGIGCNNFALYEDAKEYGVTCHHMAPKVDTGAIIAVKRFPVYPEDGVAELLERTYVHQIELFFEIVGLLAAGKTLPISAEKLDSPSVHARPVQRIVRHPARDEQGRNRPPGARDQLQALAAIRRNSGVPV